MIKKTAILVLILALAALSFGCGDKEEGSADGESYLDYDLSQYVTLGEYKGIEVEVSEPSVSDEDVDAEIQSILSSNPIHNEVTEGVVANGDTVNIDYEGKMDGVPFDRGSDQGAELTIGSGQFIPGFEEALIGTAVGDTVDLDLTFPDPYPNNPDMAGAEVVFTVTVNSICTDTLPEYTDEFVNSISDYTTTAEHRQYVADYLLKQAETNALMEKQNSVWTAILENSTFLGRPQALVDKQLVEVEAYYTTMAQNYGTDLETLVTSTMTMEEFEASMLEQAEASVDNNLILYSIAEAEGITISDEEYQEGMQLFITSSGFKDGADFESQAGVSFEEYFGKETIYQNLLLEKVINFVTDAAVEI